MLFPFFMYGYISGRLVSIIDKIVRDGLGWLETESKIADGVYSFMYEFVEIT